MEDNLDNAPQPKVEGVDGNVKLISALSYLGILFFLPLVLHPKNQFAMFHANQGLLLLIVGVAVSFLFSIPFIGWFIIGPIGGLSIFVLFIIGIINALNERMNRLPLIGNFDLLNPKVAEANKAEETQSEEE